MSDPPASAVHQNAALILSKLGATLALAERTHRLEAAVRMIADSMGDGALIGLLSEDGARVEPVIFHHPDAGAAERMLAAARALPDSAHTRLARLLSEASQPKRLDGEALRALMNEYAPDLGTGSVSSLVWARLRVGAETVGLVGAWRAATAPSHTDEAKAALALLVPCVALLAHGARLEASLSKRTEEFTRAQNELEEFVRVASHDLQEPARKVQFFAQLLERHSGASLDERGQKYLERMQRGVARLVRMMQDFLTLSRAGRRPFKLERCELSELVQSATHALKSSVEESGAAILIDELPAVLGDPEYLGILLENLMRNALMFHAPSVRPELRIGARPSSLPCTLPNAARYPAVEVLFSDNGIGFDNQHAERIFKPFERLHGIDEYPGTGMGLAICKKIVERHGGTIHANATPKAGAEFVFRLPLVKDGETS